jgi:hypothetical protein
MPALPQPPPSAQRAQPRRYLPPPAPRRDCKPDPVRPRDPARRWHMLNTVLAKMMSQHVGQRINRRGLNAPIPGMTRSTAVRADAQITQLCDHRRLGRHLLPITPNGGSGAGQPCRGAGRRADEAGPAECSVSPPTLVNRGDRRAGSPGSPVRAGSGSGQRRPGSRRRAWRGRSGASRPAPAGAGDHREGQVRVRHQPGVLPDRAGGGCRGAAGSPAGGAGLAGRIRRDRVRGAAPGSA